MNANDSNNGVLANASDKQIAANRANAKKSTGPKSPAGKFAVGKNSIEHGIYCLCPIIEDVESAGDWKCYRAAMLSDVAPVGMLEISLAERIILTAWRLRRTARYETEQIRLTQESVAEMAGVSVGLERDIATAGVDEILSDAEWREETWQNVRHFVAADDETVLSQEEAEDLLWQVHDQLGLSDSFDDFWERLPEPDAWTAGGIRQLACILAQKIGKTLNELLAGMREKTLTEATKSGRVAKIVKRRLDEYRRENLLPDTDTLEKVMRYEAHLSRLFHRDLHELQRLQARRQGQPVAAPLAIDVDVAGGPKPDVSAVE